LNSIVRNRPLVRSERAIWIAEYRRSVPDFDDVAARP
jgi:hypothetical protein